MVLTLILHVLFDFTVLKNALEEDVVKTPFVNYDAAIRVNLSSGIPLAMIREPYFNRTYEKYSSHRETPYLLEDSKYPAIVQNGNTIFFSHSIDQLYFNHGMRIHRQLFGNAINRLNPKHMIKVDNLPSSGRISFLDQKMKIGMFYIFYILLLFSEQIKFRL